MIVFSPFAPLGQQFHITGSRRDALAAMVARGVDARVAEERIDAAKKQAAKSGTRQPVEGTRRRERGLDTEIIGAFIANHYKIDPDSRVKFSTFHAAFLETLSATDQQLWTKKRVSLALPAAHPSVAGPCNVRYVVGIA